MYCMTTSDDLSLSSVQMKHVQGHMLVPESEVIVNHYGIVVVVCIRLRRCTQHGLILSLWKM